MRPLRLFKFSLIATGLVFLFLAALAVTKAQWLGVTALALGGTVPLIYALILDAFPLWQYRAFIIATVLSIGAGVSPFTPLGNGIARRLRFIGLSGLIVVAVLLIIAIVWVMKYSGARGSLGVLPPDGRSFGRRGESLRLTLWRSGDWWWGPRLIRATIALLEALHLSSLAAPIRLGTAATTGRFGGHQSAIKHARRAREIYERRDNRVGIAQAEQALGLIYLDVGQDERALAHLELARSMFQRLDQLRLLGLCEMHIGAVLASFGSADRAEDILTSAAEHLRGSGAPLEPLCRLLRGIAAATSGEDVDVLGDLDQALVALQELGLTHHSAIVDHFAAQVLNTSGEHLNAVHCARRARSQFERNHMRLLAASCNLELATASAALGRRQEAMKYCLPALGAPRDEPGSVIRNRASP